MTNKQTLHPSKKRTSGNNKAKGNRYMMEAYMTSCYFILFRPIPFQSTPKYPSEQTPIHYANGKTVDHNDVKANTPSCTVPTDNKIKQRKGKGSMILHNMIVMKRKAKKGKQSCGMCVCRSHHPL